MKNIAGLILAGGKSSRFGGEDKAWVKLNKKSMIEELLDSLNQQIDLIIVNTNRDLDRYAGLGMPVIKDSIGDFSGPLAGILSAMDYLQSENATDQDIQQLFVVPCDMPYIPLNCVEKLAKAQNTTNKITVVHDGTRLQPLVSLIPLSWQQHLQQYIDDGNRKVEHWVLSTLPITVDFSDQPDQFKNINQLSDLN